MTVQPSVGAGEDVADASESARTDLVCAEDEGIGEAREPLAWLAATCVLALALGGEIGCNEGGLEHYCPAGTTKTIVDTMDKRQSTTISCNILHDLLCGTVVLTATELMRRVCLVAK